jgi:hypothetical protein
MTGSGTATIGGSPPIPPPGWARPTDRLVAMLRARSIDDRLLNGRADGRPAVLVRRARLLNRRYRRAVAASLRKLVAAARSHQANLLRAQIPLRDEEILRSEPLIHTLADELERDERVSPRGIILADRLIRDGDSPVYVATPGDDRPDQSVESAVKHARAALHMG